MKILKNIFIIILITANFIGKAQVVGTIFPDITGETFDNKAVTLPQDTKGKYTIIGMAYSKSAESDLKTWLNPAFNKFIAKTGLMDSTYDVNIYFIPMFTGTNSATEGIAKNKLEKGTDKKLFPYVLFYKGALSKYKKALAFDKKDTAYFYVLDKDGKIIYATSGAFSEDKMDAITDKLE
ncbi:MAG: hypothetical protein ABI199_01195 [Bacteroidia bacterium]